MQSEARDTGEPASPTDALAHSGLRTDDARSRLAADGPNELEPIPPASLARLALAQIANPLVLLLVGGAAISAAVGHFVDAIAIATIVAINAAVGVVQEHKAERAAIALRSLTAPRATVVRDGTPQVILAREVVVGDLLALEPGDVVAADAELVQTHGLAANEAVLTGESLPVDKAVGGTARDAPLAERRGHVFLGTEIASGTGRAVVADTAKGSEMGRIASALADHAASRTPLQDRLARLGRIIVVACIALVAVVAVAAVVRGFPWLDVLLTSISLAVAAVPEGLPAVVTIALSVGVHRMTKRGVLVRRLAAVETLGQATVICTDKTGTLTRGQMAVREVWGREAHTVLDAAAAACDADLSGSTGDAMELAILREARSAGIERAQIERERPRVAVEPFDPATRRMTITRSDGVVYIKGAFEVVAPSCVAIPEGVEAAHAAMARRGLRVLAIASGKPGAWHLMGLIGLADPPRPEAVDAIAAAKRAGIRVVMITGDHPTTARAIATEMGLGSTEAELDATVIARATALDKLRVVKDLRARGEIVAMTGDGVNDAPSIKEADIGVAMGRTATEVTREAADMILTGDDLSGVVHAIREGRVIYGNIRKTVVYLLGGNSAELLFVIVATIAGLPIPLLPLQLLWINLLGEPLPGIALAVDAPVGDVLEQRPLPRSQPLLGRAQWLEIGLVAALQAGVVLVAYVWALDRLDVPTARTLSFSALVFGVVLRALASRSRTRIFWDLHPSTAPRLIAVVALSVALQLGVIYLGPAQALFATAPLSLPLLGLAALLGLIPVTAVEVAKLVRGA